MKQWNGTHAATPLRAKVAVLIAGFIAGLLMWTAPTGVLAGPQHLLPPAAEQAATDPGRDGARRRVDEDLERLLIALVYEQIITFNNACQSRNYAILFGKASPRFQQAYPMTRVQDMFAECGPDAFDLVHFVGGHVWIGDLYRSPDQTELKMKGHVDAHDLRLTFELQFEKIARRWKMSVMAFSLDKQKAAADYRPTSRQD